MAKHSRPHEHDAQNVSPSTTAACTRWRCILAAVTITVVAGCNAGLKTKSISIDSEAGRNAVSIPVAESTDGYGTVADGRVFCDEDDETWLLVRGDASTSSNSGSGYVDLSPAELPKSACLIAEHPKTSQMVPVPLSHTDVDARVRGYLSEVEVVQKFHNPFAEKIEAKYVFPLPHDSAVTGFVMVIGDRRIRALVKTREEAEKLYEAGRAQGYRVSMLTQERPNIFTQSVANIEPGKAIDIEITYFGPLRYVDGALEFVFPMVVGPRYNPPDTTDGVDAVARGQSSQSSQTTAVEYLAPNERSGHDIALTVDIDAGLPIESITCASHAIHVERPTPQSAKVTLSENDRIPNKDFVARFEIAGDELRSSLVTHRDERGGYFSLMLVPPKVIETKNRQPLEFVFVIDCSGSMKGKPLDIAKAAVKRCLRQLSPNDTFQIIRFSNSASTLGPRPIAATRDNIASAFDYLDALDSGGGTEMLRGIVAALDYPADLERARVVTFMTDGYIGNEVDILAAISERIGPTRIFSFGVGSSTNRYLLDGMARIGRGAAAFIGLNDSAALTADRFYERIQHPALTEPTIDWRGMEVFDLNTDRLPDVFVGRPVMLTGRFRGDVPASLTVNGRVATAQVSYTMASTNAEDSAIPYLWARQRIRKLSDALSRTRDSELATEIRDLALEYGLASAYTAFLAMDCSERTEGDHGTSIAVPVPVPEGVRYDTTVGGGH